MMQAMMACGAQTLYLRSDGAAVVLGKIFMD